MGLILTLKIYMTAEKRLLDNGYDEVLYFVDEGYDNALIGVSDCGRAIYDYDLMIEWLMKKYDWSTIESVEWIEVNTIKALPYFGEKAPIIMYKLLD